MTTTDVLVVGAGPTGMTMAIELKRAGLDVRIIDKSDHPALHSQALVVQARTLEQFQRYGIASKAVAQGRKLTEVVFWSEGKKVVSFAFERIPSRYPYVLFLPQNKTEELLNAEMESLGVKIERQIELVAIRQDGAGAYSRIRHADGQEEEVGSQWIVGCDGSHSAVRSQAAIPFEGEGVALSFFLGDLEIEGPDAPANELVIRLHSGDVVFMGRLSEKFTRLIVALHSERDKNGHRDLSIDDFQQAIDQAQVKVKIKSAEWMTPFHVSDLQAEHYRKGRLFLAGDASHIHSPVGGQGMNTGIQDAANLGWKLAAVARGAHEKLLDSYEEERGAVGKALLKFTGRGLNMATTANPILESLRDTLAPLVTRPKAVQDAMMGFVSETAIEYRSSSIVSDHGGDGTLKAGDRMPDLSIADTDTGRTLLSRWLDAKHLAVLLAASDSEEADAAKRLRHAKMMGLSVTQLDDEGRRLLGNDKKVLIVRPDGYIGFRGSLSKLDELSAYASQDGLR